MSPRFQSSWRLRNNSTFSCDIAYVSIAAEAGADPAWTTAQIGYRVPRFTISVYTDVRNRRENPAERVGARYTAAQWAATAPDADERAPTPAGKSPTPQHSA